MPTERKAIKFYGPRDCRMTTEPLEPLKDNEVRCEAIYDLISLGSEKISFRKDYDKGMHRKAEEAEPYCSGYSMSARVIEVGKDVKDYQPGDLVYANAKHRQYFNSPVEKLAKAPAGITPEQASLMTVLRAGLFSSYLGKIKMTDTVVVLGLGLFGLASLMFAKCAGARQVIGIDPIASRTERALKAGADMVFTKVGNDCYEEIFQMTGMHMIDCIIDATDDASGVHDAVKLCRSNGHVVVISDPNNADSMLYPGIARRRGVHLDGLWINMINEWVSNYSYDGYHETYGSNPFYPVTLQNVHDTIFQFILQKRINPDLMLTAKVKPSECQKVYDDLCNDDGTQVGVLFDWTLEK